MDQPDKVHSARDWTGPGRCADHICGLWLTTAPDGGGTVDGMTLLLLICAVLLVLVALVRTLLLDGYGHNEPPRSHPGERRWPTAVP